MILERFAFVVLCIPMWIVSFLAMFFVMVAGVALLPVAGLLYVITGNARIEWWGDVVVEWVIWNAPAILWEQSIKKRMANK